MVKRSLLLAALGGLILGCVLVVPTHGEVDTFNTNYLTFSGPVALPGVTLSAGTYVFERAVAIHPDVVVVRNAEGSKVFYRGSTMRASRPNSTRRDLVIEFGEAARGVPPPITAWFPLGEPTGHAFVY
ncbi:MAG: hypothetical protein IT179_05225 [Acidobacteria bacterium]|nr:hypothetical protein [Acidobacteriota bacterium]